MRAKEILWNYRWQWAVGAFLVAILGARGGLAAFVALLRVAVPVIGVVVIWKVAKRKLLPGVQEKMRARIEEAMRQMQEQNRPGGGSRTIDLCPKCGSYLKPGHRCSR